MTPPLQITFRGISPSPALEADIRERADRLEQLNEGISALRVVVELDGRHKHQGNEFTVRLDIKVPGAEIVVNRDRNEDAHVAVREAFDAARRRLEDHFR